MKLEKKYFIKGELRFKTAFHIGSGAASDISESGVLKDPKGSPLLPGSTIKGRFRATVESLSSYLNMNSCLLNKNLSGIVCISDEEYRKSKKDDFNERKSSSERIDWLKKNTCESCQLFGSPMQASRIFFSDGILKKWSRVTHIRNGVVIDRDSETAVDGLLYDYEVVPYEAVFAFEVEVHNPTDKELALLEVGISEWEKGTMIGGFTSRGLGRAVLEDVQIECVDFSNEEQVLKYFVDNETTDIERDVFKDNVFSAIAGDI